ncbi:MAG: SLC13 family permease, partial [Anaerotignaceae bacterium]
MEKVISCIKENPIKNKIINFIKKDMVLCIATVVAIVSAFFVPPSKAYFEYIDFNVLALLFCLMAVVAGFINCRLFDFLSVKITEKSKSIKVISALLTILCFFFAMLVTNDVALITFVPLTVIILQGCSANRLIFVIVMETISANLGSMLTPIGNPQNLYIYSFYNMDIADFFAVTFPVTIFALIIIVIVLCFGKNKELKIDNKAEINIDKKMLILYSLLFSLCILTVLRIIDYRICFAVILLYLLIFDRVTLKKIDYALLATFVAFFVLVGNVSNIEAVKTILLQIIDGKEFLSGIILS